MEEQTNYRKKATKKRKKVSFFHIIGGDILKEDFVVKQSKLLILIAFLSVIFISNRYSCLKKISHIEELKRELRDAKYESLVISTRLTQHSKQSQIEALVESKGLNLSASRAPAYEIQK